MNNNHAKNNNPLNAKAKASLRGEAPQEHGVKGLKYAQVLAERVDAELSGLVIQHSTAGDCYYVFNDQGDDVLCISDWNPKQLGTYQALYFARTYLRTEKIQFANSRNFRGI